MQMLYTFPNFAAYFLSSIAMLSVALWIYKLVTPYDEIGLIRAGNTAAAISYIGTVIGMVIAMASVIVNSTGWMDKVVWCVIGLAVQLGMWVVINRILGDLQRKIVDDACMSAAVALCGSSIAIGILQAACLVY